MPAVSVHSDVKQNRVSPTGSPRSTVSSSDNNTDNNKSLQDEILALRLRNQVLTNSLKAIKETADEELKKHYDLVWFARNRSRYPNHSSRKRIEQAEHHQEELEKLKLPEADYYHGIHTGMLAAARLFQQQADILHVNEQKLHHDDLMEESAKHAKKIEESRKSFPHVAVDSSPEEL